MKDNTTFKLSSELVIDASEQVVRGTVLDLLRAVILATPRDTGALQGNWQIMLDFFTDATTGNTNKEAAISKGAEELRSYNIQQTIFLGNNLEYAKYVEDGGPTNTPVGMLKRNVASLEKHLKINAEKNKVK